MDTRFVLRGRGDWNTTSRFRRPRRERWAARLVSHMNLIPSDLNMNNELRSNLCESYNRKAQERDRATTQAWKVEERRNFLWLLQQQHKRALLELGAGPGKDGKFFQDHGLAVTCIDLAPAMVDLCRQKGLTAQIDHGGSQVNA